VSHTRKLRDQNSVLRSLSAISKLAAAQKRAAWGRFLILPKNSPQGENPIEMSKIMTVVNVTKKTTGIEDSSKVDTTDNGVAFQGNAGVTLTAFDLKAIKAIRYARDTETRKGNLYAMVIALAFEGNATAGTLAETLKPATDAEKAIAALPQAWHSATSAVRGALRYGVSILKSGEMSPPEGFEDMEPGEFAELVAPKNQIEQRANAKAVELAGGTPIEVNEDFNYILTSLSRVRARLEKGNFDDCETVQVGNRLAEIAGMLTGKLTQFKVNKIKQPGQKADEIVKEILTAGE